MQGLLTVMAIWLSVNFGLPVTYDHPLVETISVAEMSPARLAGVSEAHSGQAVHAFYDDRTRTLYLPDGWSAASTRDLSLLVHEMVHHLQNAAGLDYDCPQAREALAYSAQQAWLDQFGISLEDAFEIDAMTLLVRTQCLF